VADVSAVREPGRALVRGAPPGAGRAPRRDGGPVRRPGRHRPGGSELAGRPPRRV